MLTSRSLARCREPSRPGGCLTGRIRQADSPARPHPDARTEDRHPTMASTESLTLAKALAVKNRLAGRLSQTRTNIEAYNSVLAGQRSAAGTVDVRAEFDRFRALQEALIAVKSAIQRANVPIADAILRLGELKSLVQMLNGLNTKHGTEPGYNGAEFSYDAVLRKPDVLEQVRRLEAEIDTTQDRLNQHNAATRIELPTALLDLAR